MYLEHLFTRHCLYTFVHVCYLKFSPFSVLFILFFQYVLPFDSVFNIFRDRRKLETETASGCDRSHIGKWFQAGVSIFMIEFYLNRGLCCTVITKFCCLQSGLRYTCTFLIFSSTAMRTHPIMFNSYVTCQLNIFNLPSCCETTYVAC